MILSIKSGGWVRCSRWTAGLLWGLLLAGCASRPLPEPATVVVPEDGFVIEHTVGAGESLDRIADDYYGDPARRADITRDNGLEPDGILVAGSVLRLRFDEDEWSAAQRRTAALESYNRGVELLANDRLAEAQQRFETALDVSPDLLSAKYNLALVHLKRGRTDQALTLLQELTELRPADTTFLFARGNALFQATRFGEAVEQFESALRVRPDLKRAAFGLARSLQEDGRRDAAIAAWLNYLALDGDSGWARTARENLTKLRDGDGG